MIFNIQVTSWHETISDNHEIPVSNMIWISDLLFKRKISTLRRRFIFKTINVGCFSLKPIKISLNFTTPWSLIRISHPNTVWTLQSVVIPVATLNCVWCEDKDHWAGGERVGDEVIRGYWEDRVTSGQISQHNWVIISRVIMLSVRLWPTSQALYQHLHMLVSLSGHWETLHINIWSGLLLLTVSNVM